MCRILFHCLSTTWIIINPSLSSQLGPILTSILSFNYFRVHSVCTEYVIIFRLAYFNQISHLEASNPFILFTKMSPVHTTGNICSGKCSSSDNYPTSKSGLYWTQLVSSRLTVSTWLRPSSIPACSYWVQLWSITV